MDPQISALLDSAHTINQIIDGYRQKVAGQYNQLQLHNIILPAVLTHMHHNVAHIEQCLADASYQTNLTTHQLQQLSACVADATSFSQNPNSAAADATTSEPLQ